MSTFATAADWSQLPPIPDAEGFAGTFAGVSGGALIVAGGANIAGDKWKEPFVKKWYASAFVLAKPDGAWTTAGKLERPLGYGISISADDSLLCFGGSDAAQLYSSGFRLRWNAGTLVRTPLPDLPLPCANACGALLGRTIYIAGGIQTPTSTSALRTFWALDLDAKELSWQALDPWPGAGRMLAVAAAFDGIFYLFSGAALHASSEGKPVRTFLRDAYRFTPGHGWERLADLPRSAVAAPSPAPAKDGRVLIFSGDDGANVTFEPVERHPGFPRNTLSYDTAANSWSTLDGLPFSRVTAPVAEWRGRFVIPNGEVRPRVRTNEVWQFQP
ncbi:MAG: galactose oxidase [Chthoniobacteraceae bacterium]